MSHPERHEGRHDRLPTIRQSQRVDAPGVGLTDLENYATP